MSNSFMAGIYTDNINFTSATHINWVASWINPVIVVPSPGVASFFKAVKEINNVTQCYILLDPSINNTTTDNIGQYLQQHPIASHWYVQGELTLGVATTILPNIANAYYQDFSSPSYQNYYPSAAMQLQASIGADGIVLNDMPWNRTFNTVYPNPTRIVASKWSGVSTYTSGFEGLSAYSDFLINFGSYTATTVSIFSNTLNEYIDLEDGSLSNTTNYDIIKNNVLNIVTDNNFYSYPTYYSSELFDKTLDRENAVSKQETFYLQYAGLDPANVQQSLEYAMAGYLLEPLATKLYFQPGYHGTASGSGYDLDYSIVSFPTYQSILIPNIGTTSLDKELFDTRLTGKIYKRSYSNGDVYINTSYEDYDIPIATIAKDYLTETKIVSTYRLSSKDAVILQSATGMLIDNTDRYDITTFGQSINEKSSNDLYKFLDHTHADLGAQPSKIHIATHTVGNLDSSYIQGIDIANISNFKIDWNKIYEMSHIGRVNEKCNLFIETMLPDTTTDYTKYFAPRSWTSGSVKVYKNNAEIMSFTAYPEQGYIELNESALFSDILTIAYDTKTVMALNGPWGTTSVYHVFINGSNKDHLVASYSAENGLIYFSKDIKNTDNVTITIKESPLREVGNYTHPEIDNTFSSKDAFMPFDISNTLIANKISNFVNASYIPTHTKQFELISMSDLYDGETVEPPPIIPPPDNIEPESPGTGFYGATYRVGQTFYADQITLGGARTYLSKTGTYGYDIYCSLYQNDIHGFPSFNVGTSIVNSGTYIPSIMPENVWGDPSPAIWEGNAGRWVEFKTPTSLVDISKQYSVVLSTTATSADDNLYWWTNANDYTFGNSITYDLSLDTWINNDYDRCFQVLNYVPSSWSASGIINTEKIAQIFPAYSDKARFAALSLSKIGNASYLVNVSLCEIDSNAVALPDDAVIIASKSINSMHIPDNTSQNNANSRFYTEFKFDTEVNTIPGKEYSLVLSSESTNATDKIYWYAYPNIYTQEKSCVKRGGTWATESTIDRAYFIEPKGPYIPVNIWRDNARQTFIIKYDTLTKIDVNINKVYVYDHNDLPAVNNYNVILDIYTVDANNNILDLIGTSTKNIRTIESGYNIFNFGNLILNPKQLYIMWLRQTDGDNNHHVSWLMRENYDNWGNAYVNTILQNNKDFDYKITVSKVRVEPYTGLYSELANAVWSYANRTLT